MDNKHISINKYYMLSSLGTPLNIKAFYSRLLPYPYLIFLLLALGSTAFSQETWTKKNPFEQKAFIENKGQFDGKDNQSNSQIRFGIQDEHQQVFFTSSGLTYRYDKSESPDEMERQQESFSSHAEEEKYEQEMMANITTQTFAVNMQWVGANPLGQLIAEEIVPA